MSATPALPLGARPPRGLLRVLGAAFGLAIAVGATIGGGIMRAPGDVAALLPDTGLFLGVWILGAANALLGATVFSELGTMIPRSGGEYVFAHRAMGDGVGFFVGFADWINWSVASAALVLLVGEYAGGLVPALHGHVTAVGLGILAAFGMLQWSGVRSGSRAQETTSILKTLALIVVVIAAFAVPRTEAMPAAVAATVPTGWSFVVAVALAMQGVIFAYDSYFAVVYCSEELRDPARDIPHSIFRGLGVIIVIFLLVNVAFLRIVPVGQMAGDPFVGGSVARVLFGDRGDAIIRTIMIVSILGTLNAQIMAAPRILLAMSRDGLFPRFANRVNAAGTPSAALGLTLAVIALFVLAGSFERALSIDVILIVFLYTLTFTSFFVLRRREPDAKRPYRAWGYPYLPGLALAGAVVFLVITAFGDWPDTLITLAMLAASWPASRLVRRMGTTSR